MEVSYLCYSIVFGLVTYFLPLLRLLQDRRKHRNLPPTIPGAVPILGHLHLLSRSEGKPIHRTLASLSAGHGPVLLLRFGSRPVLVISSPSAAEECLTTNDLTLANRPPLLSGKYFGFNYSTLGAASYGPMWRNLRRIASTELLSPARVQALASIRAEELRSLLLRLGRGGDIITWRRVDIVRGERSSPFKLVYLLILPPSNDRVVDNQLLLLGFVMLYFVCIAGRTEQNKRSRKHASYFPVFSSYMKSNLKEMTFNIMTRIIDGRKYYGDDETVSPELGQRFRHMIEEAFRLTVSASLEDFVPLARWLGVGGKRKQMVELKKEMDALFREMIGKRLRKEAEGEEPTVIDVMLSLQEADPKFYSDDIVKGMIWVLIAAGTDTSAGTIEWALSLLLNHPASLRKARDEIDLQVGHDRLISDSDLAHLPYLQNILKETLRLFPAGPLLAPHFSSSECTVEGYTIPKETMVLINAHAINRDPSIWKHAESFMPERFEEREEKGGKFMPFGMGRRSCPGQLMAKHVMGLTLGALIQCFEWDRIDGGKMVDLTEGQGITLPKVIPLEAFCKPRPIMVQILSQL